MVPFVLLYLRGGGRAFVRTCCVMMDALSECRLHHTPAYPDPYITKLTKEKIEFRLCLMVVNLEVYYIFIYIIYYIYKYIIKIFYL